MDKGIIDTVAKHSTLLYGKDDEERLVGIHQVSDSSIRLYSRTEKGKTVWRDELFYPFFFLSEGSLLEKFSPGGNNRHWLIRLNGQNYYQYLAIFSSWNDYRTAIDHIRQKTVWRESEEDKGVQNLPVSQLLYNKGDAVTQYLMQSGKTMFKGMIFEDLHRIQLDIETYFKPQPGTSSKVEIGKDQIIIVSMCDNRGWEQVIHTKGRSEKDLLEELVRIMTEKDPDVIEGHNIFNFDLPYIQRRCEINNVAFTIGRDGSIPRSFQTGIRFSERTIDFTFFDVQGRHVIDTYFLVQAYDATKRSMPGYGLKAAARHFGVAAENRTYVDYKDMAAVWETEPDRLLDYALDDVRETREIAALLSGSNFYLTQMIPYTYAHSSRIGPAAKIEAIMVRDYLRVKEALPKPGIGQQYSGGYNEVFRKGILGPIVYADVESLYPSIMLTYNVRPKSDTRNIFPDILSKLKDLRFEAKDAAKQERNKGETQLADNLEALQGSFKIIINAMYGYLGFSSGLFNDYEEADRVTSTGREIARQMIREFEQRGARIIEVDTDGILFIPPEHIRSMDDEIALVNEVSSVMPEGITIGYDGRYKKMISYMKKNYALLNYDGTMKLKGSALISRSAEKFGREFVREGYIFLLEEDIQGLHDLYVTWKERIINHDWSIEDFSRTESMKQSMEQYIEDVKSGKRSKAITYELAKRKSLETKKGDRITYYVTGSGNASSHHDRGKLAEEWKNTSPDENTQFYLKRLDEFTQKFLPFFKAQDFSSIFSSDTLFSFSPEGIELQREIISTSDEHGYMEL
ncbi:DNA polymerase domain-containing protein [Prosthecochloris sp. CIB 2401]|uniref:DNA polymerase domain-containing protein n=1 Tax=Prosthecochloris sp. CIB 2401 TaxID=1868325 RepID=UPI00080ABAC8|nr:DNA polymerase domain-containing protein [Prosthecochloris sp. CIB 2401]ANT63829.1 DNA polymerase II [Prosthecochloris sp. CIB 2401]